MLVFSIKGANNKPIIIDLHFSKNENAPLVIFCHGFKGFKDWGPFNYIAKKFVENGLSFLKFNFSHNGVSQKDLLSFTDLQSFAENNFSKEKYDLSKVIEWVIKEHSNSIDVNNIFLLGHSRGGGISILTAHENSTIKKVVSWASVCDYKSRFDKDKLDFWQKKGVVYVFNSRTNQQMPLYYQFYLDFIENEKKLTISDASKNLTIPTLIVHGDQDTTVDVSEAKQLSSWIKNSKLLIVKDGNHVFNSKHPFEESNLSKELELVIRETISFFKKSN
ncbi:MAG: alpha/beta hydrolase family protein [Flavobacteriales bacterium]